MGLLIGVVVLNMSGGGEKRLLQTQADRLMLQIELARQQSSVSNEIYGVVLRSDASVFVKPGNNRDWVPFDDHAFRSSDYSEEIVLNHRLLSGEFTFTSNRSMSSPDLVIYPSGEITPFEIELSHRQTRDAIYVISDGIQRAEVSNAPYKPIELTRAP